jgi:hypothetical protein
VLKWIILKELQDGDSTKPLYYDITSYNGVGAIVLVE